MNKFKIALAGNPNVGKSTIFNILTGKKQHTGNWSGKTVENTSGNYKYKDNLYEIYDLPGTYSLISHSKEELIARDFLVFNNDIDCVVVVANAITLKRSLNLVLQILEITSNVIVVVNLMDEAVKKHININLKKLSKILKVPVIATSATYNKGITNLKDEIINICTNKNKTSYTVKYDEKIITEALKISKYINFYTNSLWLSLRLLTNDLDIIESIKENLYYDVYKNKELVDQINNSRKNLSDMDITTNIVSNIINDCHKIYNKTTFIDNDRYFKKERKIDKILTSKKFGIPIMILMLFMLFWITIVGSNYPSQLLSKFLFSLEDDLYNILFFLPDFIRETIVYGLYKTTSWVVSVMLPPMMIFFPLFTILEDIGLLPRIAFNTDYIFNKCNACGKQCLTMCMGIGCNAVGVTGTRIIDDKKQRLLAIITNSFMPCNGRYPTIIAVISMFLIGTTKGILSSITSATILVLVILLSILITFLTCKILSKNILKGEKISFILELPDYRKVRIGKLIIKSIWERTIFVLYRAIIVAMPAGIILYLITNITISGTSILTIISNTLDPIAYIIGLDGVILLAFFLGLPANEIILPIILMTYLNTGILTDYDTLDALKNILINNNWTYLTAICFIIFSLFHFPCSTTLLTIKKETNSWYYTFLSFIIPLIIGVTLCFITATIIRLILFII